MTLPEAAALLPVKEYDQNKEFVNINGLLSSLITNSFPVEHIVLPVLIAWSGVNGEFEETVQLFDPTGTIVASQTTHLNRALEWGYGLRILPLESALTVPGIYTLKLFANNQFKLSRQIVFNRKEQPLDLSKIKHTPQLTAFLIAKHLEPKQPDTEYRLISLMGSWGVSGKDRFSIFTSWDYLTHSFKASAEFLNPYKDILLTLPFEVKISEKDFIAHINLDLTFAPGDHPTKFKKSGVYYIRFSFEGQRKTYPLLLNL